jgi:hypothetical protein
MHGSLVSGGVIAQGLLIKNGYPTDDTVTRTPADIDRIK